MIMMMVIKQQQIMVMIEMQPIDEMFMFLYYFALGSRQCDHADQDGAHQYTVSCIIVTQRNFLYTVLGSVRIGIPKMKVQRLCKHYSDPGLH